MKCKPHLHKLVAGPIDGHTYVLMVDGTRDSITEALRTLGRWASVIYRSPGATPPPSATHYSIRLSK